jgi:hypothetical protein
MRDPGVGSSRRPRLSRPPAIAALVAIALLTLLPHVTYAADGINDTARTTYELLPGQNAIRVTIDLRVENHVASRTQTYACTRTIYDPYYGYVQVPATCSRTTTYYVNATGAWIEDTAQQVKVTADSGSVSTKVEKRDSGFRLLRLTFKPVFRNQVRKLHLTYVLVGGKPRTDTAFRAGAAYAAFCAIGNGVDGGSVTVVLPSGFDVDTNGGTVTKTTGAGKATYASGQLKEPLKFYACFEGTNDAAFKRTTIHSTSGRELTIEGWPEDATWNGEVENRVTMAVARLEELFGRGLPGAGSIRIREASTNELGDYAGVFDPATQTARITEDLSEESTVAHELAHSWFNKWLFTDTWLDEGYAEWAARTVNQGRVAPCTDPGPYPGDGQPTLRDWKYLGPKPTVAEEKVVGYNYDASCYLIAQLANAMGPDRMRDVLQYLFDRRIPYLSGSTDRLSSGAVPIHAWLDVVDEVGLAPAKADLDLAQKLLLKYGIETDATALARRSSARQAYHDYLATATGWSTPEFLAREMADWKFDDAAAALSITGATRSAVAQADQALPGIDAVNGPVKQQVQTATSLGDLKAAQGLADNELEAAKVVAPAVNAAKASRNPIEEIGLVGVDLSKLSADAVTAVKSGNAQEAKDDAAQIHTELDAAMTSGAVRVGAGVLAIVGLGTAFAIARRGPGRRRSTVPGRPTGPVAPGDADAELRPSGPLAGSAGEATTSEDAAAPAEPRSPPSDDP